MITEKKNDYTLITVEQKNIENFFSVFEEKYPLLANDNVIINISKEIQVENKSILLFLNYSEFHLEKNTSFIIVCEVINIDDFPENFNIVPTLKEAEDVLEIENIQRDLEF